MGQYGSFPHICANYDPFGNKELYFYKEMCCGYSSSVPIHHSSLLYAGRVYNQSLYSLSLSLHPSLLIGLLGSIQCLHKCKSLLVGIEIHLKISLMSSSLLSPAYIVRLTWTVYEIGGR